MVLKKSVDIQNLIRAYKNSHPNQGKREMICVDIGG